MLHIKWAFSRFDCQANLTHYLPPAVAEKICQKFVIFREGGGGGGGQSSPPRPTKISATDRLGSK
jgi:hypothetical protein